MGGGVQQIMHTVITVFNVSFRILGGQILGIVYVRQIGFYGANKEIKAFPSLYGKSSW